MFADAQSFALGLSKWDGGTRANGCVSCSVAIQKELPALVLFSLPRHARRFIQPPFWENGITDWCRPMALNDGLS